MKKIINLLILTMGIVGVLGFIANEKDVYGKSIEYKYEEVKDEVIRFHVLANSDSNEDQKLKLKVRDSVIKYLEPLLNESKSIEESRRILKENNKKVIEISNEVIKKEGFKYSVKTELKKENFPEKIYGNIVLPQGEYEAYRILIEKAEGQNWWCVMFPPLCFIDVTKEDVAYEETKKRMDNLLENEKEKRNFIVEERNENINVKFKFIEILDDIFSK